MGYRPFHMSRIGATHIRRGLPCQDVSSSETYRNSYIAVVADGHGSRRHFRSDRGATIACQVALENIRMFLDTQQWAETTMEDRLTELKLAICRDWGEAVRTDYKNVPWTEAELEEERALLCEEQFAALLEGKDTSVAYGTTLCATFLCDSGWAAIQLGDGCFVRVSADGAYDWLMPKSMINEGSRTASLCMREPISDFRHCWGTDRPAALLAFTDGVEKPFPPQGKEIMSLLHWIWRNACTDVPEREKNLTRTLDMLTRRSPNGDDVSVAGIVDPESEDAEPLANTEQRQMELARLEAQLAEFISTIQFNEQRLKKARQNKKDVRSGAVDQMRNVADQKRAAAEELLKIINTLRAELGLPPANSSLPELETIPNLGLERTSKVNTESELEQEAAWGQKETKL